MPATFEPAAPQPSAMPITISTASPASVNQTIVPTVSMSEGTQYPSVSITPSITDSYTPSVFPSSFDLAGGSDSIANIDDQVKRETESESLPAGGVAGIVLSSVFVFLALAYIYANKKRKRADDDPDLREVRNKDLDELEAGARVEMEGEGTGTGETVVGIGGDDRDYEGVQVGRQHPVSDIDDDDEDDDENFIGTVNDHTLQLSDIAAQSPPSSSTTSLISGMPTSPKRARLSSKGSLHDDSSSAGESGWSSSAGMSSLNTSSFDGGLDDGSLLPGSPGRLLATISAADAAAIAAGSTQRDAK